MPPTPLQRVGKLDRSSQTFLRSSSGIEGSRQNYMRELRIQHKGDPYRVLYAFDPRHSAILLIGGNKAGSDRWYAQYVPIADKLYDDHLGLLEDEGLL